MRFMAMACDYDGTLATHGRVDDQTVKSLERCLESGRKLLMVTGRELPELLEIFPYANLFEWIVAENGALLYRPATKQEIPLAPPPSEEFVSLLRAKGITRISIGRVIVATWQPHETTVLRAIRDLGLELQVIFNKGAVMVLPSGVNKATGMFKALAEMGLSPHNVVAVGDAENDHALLAGSEAGVAVANAVPMLKEHADMVAKDTHGAGVQELVERLLTNDLADLEPRLTRHHLLLGHEPDGTEFKIQPFRPNLLIAGTTGGGKSTVAAAVIERLAEKGYQVCVIDPEGDYGELPEAVSIGTPKQSPNVDAVIKLLSTTSQTVVVNLLGIAIQDRPNFFLSLLGRIQDLRANFGRPHWLVVDEAHHVWPTNWQPGELHTPQRLDRTLLITLEPTLLPEAVLKTVDMLIAVGKQPAQTLRLFAEANGIATPTAKCDDLEQGDFLVWEAKTDAKPKLVKIRPARGPLQRHIRKYAEGELEPERSFYFRGPDRRLNLRAQNLIMFLQIADGVDDETWNFHLRQGDYSQWFRKKIKDTELAEETRKVESGCEMSAAESRRQIRELVEARYTLPATPATPVSARVASSEERGKSPAV